MALLIEGEISLRAYKHKVQDSHLQIEKYQKAVEDKDILIKNAAKIMALERDVLDKSYRLNKMETSPMSKL